jgi:hypothetical protein
MIPAFLCAGSRLAQLMPQRPREQPSPTGSTGSVLVLCALASLLAGCVWKSTAEANARMAYLAGQQAGFVQAQQQQFHGPSVRFIGAVQNPVVKWSEGLMLGQAIVKAVYSAPTDPKNIVIRRQGDVVQFDPKRLLNGEDYPLEAGDIIELQP